MSLIANKDFKKYNNVIPIAREGNKMIGVSFDENAPKEVTMSGNFDPVAYLDLENNQRSAVFIAGPSGSGKSTMARKIVEGHRKRMKDPKRFCVLFAPTSTPDPAFSGLKNFLQISMKDDPDYTSITMEHLRNKTVIVDDFQVLPKPLLQYTMQLVGELLELSRKLNIQIIIVSHTMQNYTKTKTILFESDTFITFPSSNRNAFKKFAASYFDVSKNEAEDMVKDAGKPFQPLIFRKSMPRYYMTDKVIRLLE